MTFEAPARLSIQEGILMTIPVVMEKKDWLLSGDSVLFPSGVQRCLRLRDRYNRTWRDHWTICLREDGKLALMYHRRKVENGILVRVTKPLTQRAWGISINMIWKLLPSDVLGRVLYHLDTATGDPYAAYGYPLWAFTPPQGRW